jgi:hypothetical protein
MKETNPSVVEIVQRIAQEASSRAEDREGRLLVLTWAEDGVCSADLLQEHLDDQMIDYLPGPIDFVDLVLEFRDLAKKQGSEAWSGFALLIDGESFSIDFFYQEIDDSFDSLQYREQHIRAYLGDFPIRHPTTS